MLFEVVLLVVVGTSIWVYLDARSIGETSGHMIGGTSPGGWLAACLLLWIVVFPLYLVKRDQFKRVNQKQVMPPSQSRQILRQCPFCAEDVRVEAIKCKHCGSAIEPVSTLAAEPKPNPIEAVLQQRRDTYISPQVPPAPQRQNHPEDIYTAERRIGPLGVLGLIALAVLLFIGIVAVLGPSDTSPSVQEGAQVEAASNPTTRAEKKKPSPGKVAPAITKPIKEEPRSAKPTGWRTVASWGGSGTKTTESFQITGSEWRINWKTSKGGLGVDLIQIYVYDASGSLVSLAANAMDAGSDTSYMHSRAGRYYLTVNTATNWAIVIEER